MQRISTWTVFKGEPVFFQAGSEGCCSSRTPGADVPSSLNATPRPSPPSSQHWQHCPGKGGLGRPPRAGCRAEGQGSLVPRLWFLGFPRQGDDSPLFPVPRCAPHPKRRRWENSSCWLSNGIVYPCPSIKTS